MPDAELLEATIETVVVERSPVEERWPQHLCPGKGYDNEDGWGACGLLWFCRSYRLTTPS